MLGCISVRTGEAIEWDEASGRMTRGSAEAQALLRPKLRAPFTI